METIQDIDTTTELGMALMAALAIITTESRTTQTPDEVLGDIMALKAVMFKQ